MMQQPRMHHRPQVQWQGGMASRHRICFKHRPMGANESATGVPSLWASSHQLCFTPSPCMRMQMFEMDAYVGVDVLGLSFMKGEQPHAGERHMARWQACGKAAGMWQGGRHVARWEADGP